MRIRVNQRGDTIVEVLIAVAVVSLVLTGAFTIANASLKQIRMAQARSEAEKVASAIVEELPVLARQYNLVDTDDGVLGGGGSGPYCKHPTSPAMIAYRQPECSRGFDNRYRISITRLGGQGTARFEIRVNWDGENGPEEIMYNYKVNNATT